MPQQPQQPTQYSDLPKGAVSLDASAASNPAAYSDLPAGAVSLDSSAPAPVSSPADNDNPDVNSGFWSNALHAVGLPTPSEFGAKWKQQRDEVKKNGFWNSFHPVEGVEHALENPSTYGPVPAIIASAVHGAESGYRKGAPEISDAINATGGDVLPRVAEAVQGAGHIAAGALAPVGGEAADTLAEQLTRRDENGELDPNWKGALGNVAGNAAGILLAEGLGKVGARVEAPTADQLLSIDDDVAKAARDHLRQAAKAEHDAAAQQVQAVDAQIDQAHPEGAVNGTEVVQSHLQNKIPTFPEKANRVVAEAGSGVPVTNRPGNMLSEPLIDELRQNGILEDRMYSAQEARQRESFLRRTGYKLMKAGDRPNAANYFDLADQFAEARRQAAQNAGVLDDFLNANSRYHDYLSTFVNPDSPVAKMVSSKRGTAKEVLGPLSKNSGVRNDVRELLSAVPDNKVNVDDLLRKGDFHDMIKAATAPGANESIRRNLLTSALMMAGGAAIDHPFIGTMFAARTAREAINQALRNASILPEMEDMEIQPKTGKYSRRPKGKPSTFRERLVPSIIANATQAAQNKPGRYGVPHFVHGVTGQRVAYDGQGGYYDVDTGEQLPWRWTGAPGGKQ